jgi:hypothetical protein
VIEVIRVTRLVKVISMNSPPHCITLIILNTSNTISPYNRYPTTVETPIKADILSLSLFMHTHTHIHTLRTYTQPILCHYRARANPRQPRRPAALRSPGVSCSINNMTNNLTQHTLFNANDFVQYKDLRCEC